MLLLQQMTVMLLMMIIGFICFKTGLITTETNQKLSGMVVNIANPALILSASICSDGYIAGEELLQVVLLAILVYAILLLLGELVVRILRIPKESHGSYCAMLVFSNIGFMGFPIISALYGSSALLYASIFLIPYNLLIYTYGIRAMASEETRQNQKGQKIQWKKIFNIGVIACIITIVIYLAEIPMPAFVVSTVQNLSNLTAPLSMMVIGASLATIRFKELFTDGKLLIFSGIKLLLIPILGVLLIKQVISNEVILGVCMIMLATPVGSMTAMLAQDTGGDYELATRGVTLTTILSVATVPIVSLFL